MPKPVMNGVLHAIHQPQSAPAQTEPEQPSRILLTHMYKGSTNLSSEHPTDWVSELFSNHKHFKADVDKGEEPDYREREKRCGI